MRWVTNKEQSEYMRQRRRQNLDKGLSSAERWVFDYLKGTNHKFSIQKVWGARIFDFWCGHLGCAVEVDGPEHNIAYDNYRDNYNSLRSAIIVLRVRNFNQNDIITALNTISKMEPWKKRREKLWTNRTKKGKRAALRKAKIPDAHGQWIPPKI